MKGIARSFKTLRERSCSLERETNAKTGLKITGKLVGASAKGGEATPEADAPFT